MTHCLYLTVDAPAKLFKLVSILSGEITDALWLLTAPSPKFISHAKTALLTNPSSKFEDLKKMQVRLLSRVHAICFLQILIRFTVEKFTECIRLIYVALFAK